MPSVLDIFSGCGGLSLGAHQAGMTTAVAVDADPLLSSSFGLNFPATKMVRQDIRKLTGRAVSDLLPNGVDGVIGGPPCQAFSEMGRRDPHDPRRQLVLEYFRVVAEVKPKFFLFENVRGFGSRQNISLLEDGLAKLSASWKIFGPDLVNAADFGAPTRRKRLFVFGFDTNKMTAPTKETLLKLPQVSVSVRDAIGDIRSARFVGDDEKEFDVWRYDDRLSTSDYAAKMRSRKGSFTGHRKTQHTSETLKRFAKLDPGASDKIGKYVRLKWDGLCPTLRAGTGNDRGSYQAVRPIHPTEDRVITAREAARLQGFPDGFLFHPTVWHSCRMIGNSVSPIVAKAFLSRIAKRLKDDAR